MASRYKEPIFNFKFLESRLPDSPTHSVLLILTNSFEAPRATIGTKSPQGRTQR
jgi:hypothetical protein